MSRMVVKAFLAALLLAVLTVSPSAAQDLGLIAYGLTPSTLCPLVKSQPEVAINAVASGAAAAYDQGPQAQTSFAQSMATAVMAASANGCIDELFEGVNQAIIKGGYKVEYVTGKAISIGVAQGTASDGGQVLAKATAVVMCRGGASAQACAKAWNQAIKFDPKNGCAVLVQAFVQARARCAAGKALTEVKAQVWKTPLGFCKAPAATYGTASGSYSGDKGSITVSQGKGYNKITYPDGTVVIQGPGVSSSVWVTSGPSSGKNPIQVTQGPNGQVITTDTSTGVQVSQGPAGQQISFGRKMLAAQNGISAGTKTKGTQSRQLLGAKWWPFDTSANSNAIAVNNGNANGGVFANSGADAQDYGLGSTEANSAATAINNGNANGPVVATSYANADGGRKLKNAQDWPFGGTTANSAATAVNNGFANGGVFANSGANAQGYGWGPTTANSQATAVNNGYANGPVVANSVANAYGRKLLVAGVSTNADAAANANGGGRKLQSVDNWPFDVNANSAALATNNGNANGDVTANSIANAAGFGQVTANSNSVAMNNGNANGAVTANSNANAVGH